MKTGKVLGIIIISLAVTLLAAGCAKANPDYEDETGKIKLGNYKGVEISLYDKEITDEEIDQFIRNKAESENVEITEEWIKEATGGACTTLEEYMVKAKEDLKAFRAKTNADTGQIEVLREIVKNSEFELDKKISDQKFNEELNKFIATSEASGQNKTDLIKSYGYAKEEDFNAAFKRTTDNIIKQNLAMHAIYEKEKMELTEEDYKYEEEKYGRSIEELKEETGEDVVELQTKFDKVLRFIFENAKVTYTDQ